MQKIVIIGSSGHAKVIIDIIEKQGHFQILGLIDSFRLAGDHTLGYLVLGGENDLPKLAGTLGLEGIFVAIGDNFVRSRVAMRAAELCPTLPFVKAIHPSAVIGKSVSIGAGAAVMAGVVINSCCAVGSFCIVNTKVSLDHDSTMEEYSSLAPGVTTGGSCHIGAFAAVGISSSIKHGVTIGEHAVIGAGSTVLNAVEPMSIAYGTPARLIRMRDVGDKYL